MAELVAFSMAVGAILYVMWWLWRNDDDVESNKPTPFSPPSDGNDNPQD